VHKTTGSVATTRLAWCLVISLVCPGAFAHETSVTPATMARMGTVDERFQSYNVEMIEVTGGRFWKPYRLKTFGAKTSGPKNSHADSDLYEYRTPIDLTNRRLRKLAAALAPAYMRVSGTWANATYFADSDSPLSAPPSGFNGILSREQWRGVVEFSQAVGTQIVTSFAVSRGTRDPAGVWMADQARRLLTYTRSIGGTIAAAEFMNEPNLATMGDARTSYDAAEYGRDFRIFRSLLKKSFPEIMILGPGTIGATASASGLLMASGPGGIDALSYHHYGALSERCSGASAPETALSEDWLSRTDQTLNFYRSLRDEYEPGKPIWLTETADAACGGNRWAASFLDTFRYLDQLGRLAKTGIQIVMHNTLAASDYGLLDEKTLAPRPNYWGAVLWRQLMGSTVLDSGVTIQNGLHVYAHCQRGTSGGVSLLIINPDRNASHTLMLPLASRRYTLDAASLRQTAVRLNGHALRLSARDELPRIEGAVTTAGTQTFAPATITFLTVPAAANRACQ
jgi:hypothetical protein